MSDPNRQGNITWSAAPQSAPLPIAYASCENSNYSGTQYVAVATATPVAATPNYAPATSGSSSYVPSAQAGGTSSSSYYTPSAAASMSNLNYNSNSTSSMSAVPMASATTNATVASQNGQHYVAPTIFSPPLDTSTTHTGPLNASNTGNRTMGTASSYKAPSIFTPPPGWVEPPCPNTGEPCRGASNNTGRRNTYHSYAPTTSSHQNYCNSQQQNNYPPQKSQKKKKSLFQKMFKGRTRGDAWQ